MHVRDPCRAPSIVAAPLGYLFELGGGNEKPQKALGMGAESGGDGYAWKIIIVKGGGLVWGLGSGMHTCYMLVGDLSF